MPIFFTMMILGACGIVFLAFRDVESAPWNKWLKGSKKETKA